MLSSEFSQHMGALIRSLEQKVRNEPNLRHEDVQSAQDHIEQAIVILVALHLQIGGME